MGRLRDLIKPVEQTTFPLNKAEPGHNGDLATQQSVDILESVSTKTSQFYFLFTNQSVHQPTNHSIIVRLWFIATEYAHI